MTDMPDPIVTYADLDAIAVIERECAGISCSGEAAELLRRLRAAAEADAPPLPEGWVLLVGDDGVLYPYWHEDNRLSSGKGKAAYKIEATAASMRDRLTPLRPTITEADVERAARGFHEKGYTANWSALHDETRAMYFDSLRAAFAAAGVVIEP